MKKCLAIVMLICLLLSGCSQPSADQAQTTAPIDDTTAGTEAETVSTEASTEPDYSQQPMFAVSVPTTVLETVSDDGNVIFRQTSQSMYLTMQDPDVADMIILDFLNRVDKIQADAESVRLDAENAYSGSENWNAYISDLVYSPTRIDQSVLSLYGSYVTYSGGMHPHYACTAANYDMVTGDVLTLGSILYHIDAIEPLCALVIEQLDAVAEEYNLFSNYQSTVRQRFAGEESYDEDWYFSDTGLCFYFAPYEIAPYTSGIIIAEIPYEELTGIIGDAFFPPEYDAVSGTVYPLSFEYAALDSFTQIAEVTLDTDGEMLLLYTDTVVTDIRLTMGAWNESGTEFTANYTVFATNALSPGSAIMLKATPDTMAALQLSYRSAEEIVTVTLSQSAWAVPA